MMMALGECDRFHGNTILLEGYPECKLYENVLYMPLAPNEQPGDRSFGLYDCNGQLIEAAGKFVGPRHEPAGPKLFTEIDHKKISNFTQIPVFYMGWLVNHYGHFLVDTLCRMWAWTRIRSPKIKILYHGDLNIDQFLQTPFVAEIFEILSLTANDFIKFDQPIIIHRVIIANPAFEELNFCYRAFTNFFNEIGSKLLDRTQGQNDTPIYLTKMNLKSGISHYVNEADFVERLSKSGVEIISPESMSLREQIALFHTRTTITGLLGSAFHTSMFIPYRKFLVLNYEQLLWTNQILIDKANRNRSIFVYDLSGSVNEGRTPSFGNNFRMENPKRLAEDFLRRIDFFIIENKLLWNKQMPEVWPPG